jgi:hypothetical protein
MGFVDGTIKEPAKMIAGAGDDAAKVPNPVYSTWFRLDQQVLSAILASLTPGLLGAGADVRLSLQGTHRSAARAARHDTEGRHVDG